MMFEIVDMLGMFMNFPNKFQVNVAMLYFYNYFYISAMGFFTCIETIYFSTATMYKYWGK